VENRKVVRSHNEKGYRKSRLRLLGVTLFVMVICLLLLAGQPVQAGLRIQQPTVDIPTVTGTPTGPLVTVPIDQVFIYVRSGPGGDPIYPKIGILVTGQQVPALGISGDYIQIVYVVVPGNVGWVHRLLVQLDGALPEITPPPTPTARVTPTLDPTLAAEYLIEIPPTSLPTYTRPAPLALPTYAPDSSSLAVGNVPAGFVIIGLAVVGLFGILITLLRGR
jgi:hypothetical protein